MEDLDKEAGPLMTRIARQSPADHHLIITAMIRKYGPVDFDPDKTPVKGILAPPPSAK